MINHFDVLDRNQNVHGSRLLEASAGTGKTFAIENIVVRLMVEESPLNPEPLRLNQILVVTFTNPATHDLKVRIRANLVRCINILSESLKGNPVPANAPGFLEPFLADQAKARKAKTRLEQGLACFEESAIYTIHSFCSRMLREYVFEGGQSFQDREEDGKIAPSTIRRLIKDFFLTGIKPACLTKGQLNLAMGKGAEHLENELYKVITRWMEIEPVPKPLSHFDAFVEKMRILQKETRITSASFVEEFIRTAPCYKGICSTDNIPKPENLKLMESLASLYDKDAWDPDDFDVLLTAGPDLLKWLHPGNRKTRIPAGVNPQADFYDPFEAAFADLIGQASNPQMIFGWMAKECRRLVMDYLEKEEMSSFDMLLHSMKKALDSPEFVQRIRQRFKAAIVDEFQDTDPVQWDIFKRLFLNEGSFLYLVGDPKQSIYAFRQADIYTYMQAATAMGSGRQSSLDTNYRSQPKLIKALNAVFDPANAPGLISLPRLGRSLPYQPVKAGAHQLAKPYSDGNGSLHFFTLEYQKQGERKFPHAAIEENFMFPFICQEILKLRHADNIPYKQFAILVKDRFQAQKLMSFMARLNIPASLQKTSSLAGSQALSALQELLQGILTPRDESSLKTALGGPIIGFTLENLLALTDHARWEKALADFYALRRTWMEEGFAVFFEHLLQSRWLGVTVGEHLLLQEGGAEFYQDLAHTAELVVEYEASAGASPYKCLEFLDDFDKLELDDDPRLKRRIDPNRDAVKVLTLHASKGLEFDIVFALGLFNRTPNAEGLFPDAEGQSEPKLIASKGKDDPKRQSFCAELDAEKIRQLYVALTRAKYRLYVPAVFYVGGGSCDPGTASPMELYLARLGQNVSEEKNLYERIINPDPGAFYAFLETLKSTCDISYTKLLNQPFDLQADVAEPAPDLCPPKAPIVPGCFQVMYSFTTLSKHGSHKGESLRFPETAPREFLAPVKSPHTLPTGSETGNILHEILEKIPFYRVNSAANPSAIHSLLRNTLDGTPYEDWIGTAADIIFKALKNDLSLSDAPFTISQLSEGEFYREHEFIYAADGLAIHPEFTLKDGFVKGVIDLIFIHQGKYYLLDWKSNWLGPGPEYYSMKNMEISMHEHQYFLQADLYKEALRRYLKIVDSRAFDSIFGGILYVFLRGVDNIHTRGIYKLPC